MQIETVANRVLPRVVEFDLQSTRSAIGRPGHE